MTFSFHIMTSQLVHLWNDRLDRWSLYIKTNPTWSLYIKTGFSWSLYIQTIFLRSLYIMTEMMAVLIYNDQFRIQTITYISFVKLNIFFHDSSWFFMFYSRSWMMFYQINIHVSSMLLMKEIFLKISHVLFKILNDFLLYYIHKVFMC